MRQTIVPKLLFALGLVLAVSAQRVPAQMPVVALPPRMEIPGSPDVPLPGLLPLPAPPTAATTPNTDLLVPPLPAPIEVVPEVAPKPPVKTPTVKMPPLKEPIRVPVPDFKETVAPLQPVQPVQPTPPARPPAFRLLSPPGRQPAPTPPLPPVAVVVERPAVMAGPPPGNATVTPTLTLEKKGPAAVQLNQAFPYEITVRNVGSVVAQQVRLEDQLPTGTRFISALPPATVQGDRLGWLIDQLQPGAELRILVEVQPTTVTDWQGNATVTVSISKGWRTAVTGPQLLLSVTGPSSVVVGTKAVFQICITNSGAAPLTKLMLNDRLPPGLECTQALGNEIEANIGTLAPGETRKLNLETIATDLGHQVNETLIMTGEGQQASTRAIIQVIEPILRLRQTGPTRPEPNREHDYRLEIVNRDKIDAHNLRVSEVLPEGMKFVSAGDNGSYDPATRSVVWSVAVVPAGQQRVLSMKLMPQASGPLLTQATAHSDQGHDATLYTILHAGMPTPVPGPVPPPGASPVQGRGP